MVSLFVVAARELGMTNHHCAHSYIAQQSRDLNTLGFYAASETSEIKCPDSNIYSIAGEYGCDAVT